MFLGCKCCDEPCNTAARSGGAGITINRYAMPDYGGTVEFYYNAYRVPDRFTIYNTNSEDEIYFDTAERVSGSKTIKFYKPKGVRSVSVKVDGPSGTVWDYRIGCPELSCLVKNCHSDIVPTPILDSITLTLDVPSYKLRIPRIGAEYWYHYREPFGPQSSTYSFGDLGQRTFNNPFNPNGEYVDKIPVVLPLDFKAPQLHRDEWTDASGITQWTWSQAPTQRGISQAEYGTRVIPPEEYVRPDQFLKGWFKGGTQFVRDGEIFEETIGYSAGEWEYVGKIEFEGYWELDGDAYSGTYELQKVQKENGEYVYVYYFDEGEPYCNSEAINDTARLYCGRQGEGLGYAKSFILVDGCSIHISNLKVKFRYGLTDNDPSCQPIYDMDNFVFNGYVTIDGSQSAVNTIGNFPVTPINITPEGLEGNSSIPLGCSYGIALRDCTSRYEIDWSPSVRAWGHGYKSGVPEVDSSNTNNAVVSSNSLYTANNQQDQEDDVCYGDLDRLLALREVCTYSKEFVDDECNPTCAAIITPYNGLSAQMYSYDEQAAKPVTLEAAVSTGDISVLERSLYGGAASIRFRDVYFRQSFPTGGSGLNQLEFNLYSATNYGPSQFVIEDFFGGGHYWSGTPVLANFNPTKQSTSSYEISRRGTELALPWLPTWIQTYLYDWQGNPFPWQVIAPHDPYYEETGYVWYDRCSLQSPYNSPPMGLNEWLCGKCATQWYVDQGLWIEEWPSRRFAEILVTDIMPHLSN